MFNIERWQEIFEAISKNKLRTFLTGVSVASGIFILVILLGAGRGIQNGIQNQFAQDATNRISIWPGNTSKEYKGLGIGRETKLKNRDYEIVTQKFEDYIDNKSAIYSVWSGNVVFGKETGTYRVEGVDPNYQFIENASIIEGRFINYSDIDHYEKAAVIGKKVATDLFKKGIKPLGQSINISGMMYKVVGVFTDPGGEREETRVFIPLSTAQKAYSAGDNIRSMAFTMPKETNFNKAVAESKKFTEELGKVLKERHMIAPDDESALFINNSLEQAQNIYKLTDAIQAFFWFVGILTIIAGVVGVGNIMLIVVKERTKEIGIRKALGASPASIIFMILHESVFITLISGFMGLLFGLLLWAGIGPLIESDFFSHPEVDFNIALTTVILLTVAGGFAGFIPAYKAAKIKPIVALRDE
ncbi:putative ABC transport system permease protein [Flavobacterium arsenatis]|uniref:ABC transport system permease protein n=1 Tax=Flavobacterium arsenatis TaxID=1484332 RepID=A0ABU1TKK2_9FLAO|nr:ABC transporter permease [Flavobacterium arsenatis]MDR6966474.1 putative ABC transport system permease protein [Flavobacterium arsenatis]